MTWLEWLILLVVAGVCGSIARSLAGYSHGGCLLSVVVGFIGALLGTWLANLLKLPDPFVIRVGEGTFPIIWSIIGGALFSALLNLFVRRPPLI